MNKTCVSQQNSRDCQGRGSQLTIQIVNREIPLVLGACTTFVRSENTVGVGHLSQCAPPGAVGAQYGSGCFHFSSSFSVSFNSAYTRFRVSAFFLPFLPIRSTRDGVAYPLQSRIGDIPVVLEEGADVERLATPEVAMHRPVESQLQRAAVERADSSVSSAWYVPSGVAADI